MNRSSVWKMTIAMMIINIIIKMIVRIGMFIISIFLPRVEVTSIVFEIDKIR